MENLSFYFLGNASPTHVDNRFPAGPEKLSDTNLYIRGLRPEVIFCFFDAKVHFRAKKFNSTQNFTNIIMVETKILARK